MEKKSGKSFRSLAGYFLLGLLFALLSILASRPIAIQYTRMSFSMGIDTRWIFWLLLIFSAICMVPLLVAVLRGLYEQKILPKSLGFFFGEESKADRDRIVWKLRTWLFGRIGMTIITGAAILLLNVFLTRSSAIDDDDVNGRVYELVLQLRGVEHVNLAFSKVAQLLYLTPSNDVDEHLRDLLKIVTDLKSAGAKAVLITLPEFPPEGKGVFPLLRQIEKSGIVVWGVPFESYPESPSKIADSLDVSWPSVAHYMTEANELWRGPFLSRLWHFDVALSLLWKYESHPPFEIWQWLGNEIDSRIPMTKKGWVYALDRYTGSIGPDLYVHRGGSWQIGMHFGGGDPVRGFQFTKYVGPKKGTDTLGYYTYHWASDVESPWLPFGQKTFEWKVKDKIVLLAGNYGRAVGPYLPDRAYAVGLESVLQGNLMKKPASGYLWLSLACLALAGFFAYRFRPLAAILLMFVLAVCTLVFGSYLYDSLNIIIDIFYPLLSIGIAVIVFPTIAVMSGEHEEQRKVSLKVVLGVVLAAIVLYIGFSMLRANPAEDTRNVIIQDLQSLAARARYFYQKPSSEGGGGKSFSGITMKDIAPVPEKDAFYFIESVQKDNCVIAGVGKVLHGPDSVRVRIRITENRNVIMIIN